MEAAGRRPADLLPMRATPGPVPCEPGWAFEFTWDGVRSLAEVGGDGVRLLGGKTGDIERYPELDVLPGLIKRRVLLDGKIVALDAWGKPSFSRLARRMHLTRPSAAVLRRVPVAYYVFDVLRLDDHCTLALPYRQRRELLADLRLTGGPIALPPHFLGLDGRAVLDTAAEYGLHGVVAKRVDSRYRPGRRSQHWVQTTLRRHQDVVVGGWVPGPGGPEDTFGSLLLGVPSETGLRYVGRVFHGFSDAARNDLMGRLRGLARRSSPFVGDLPEHAARQARWAAPRLLGQVSYERWTQLGRVKQPVWCGLYPGKHPVTVRGPVLLDGTAQPATSTTGRTAPKRGTTSGGDDPARSANAVIAESPRPEVSSHFFYNALTAIAAVVHSDPGRARELLMDFAGFTRYYLRPTRGLTTLADELENVERYLALEQARLEERLRVSTRIDPRMMDVLVPPLTVHRVVENAVRHGIEELPGGGALSVSAAEAAPYCAITVTVDGPRKSSVPDLGEVEEGLRSAFGEDYVLTTDSMTGAAPVSTVVSLRVPLTCASQHGEGRGLTRGW